MARVLISLFSTLAVGAAACADDPALDPSSVAEGLATVLFQDDPTIPTHVDCPDPDTRLIAQPLTCTASLHGEPITIDVVIDEEGVASVEVRERLLELAEVEAELGEQLLEDLEIASVDVECPGEFVVDAPGIGFNCVATHDDRPLTFEVEIVDDDSTWTATLVPSEPELAG